MSITLLYKTKVFANLVIALVLITIYSHLTATYWPGKYLFFLVGYQTISLEGKFKTLLTENVQ